MEGGGGIDKEGGPHNDMTHRQLYLIWSGYSCGFLSRNAFKLYICSENIAISSGEYLLVSCRKKCEGVCMADSAQHIDVYMANIHSFLTLFIVASGHFGHALWWDRLHCALYS